MKIAIVTGGSTGIGKATAQPLADQTALGRIGTPEDIGNVIVNLLSDDFGWVTAQDFDVSGGFMLTNDSNYIRPGITYFFGSLVMIGKHTSSNIMKARINGALNYTKHGIEIRRAHFWHLMKMEIREPNFLILLASTDLRVWRLSSQYRMPAL